MNVRSCKKKKEHVTKKEKQESKDNGGNLTPELSKRERGAVQGTGREISLRAGQELRCRQEQHWATEACRRCGGEDEVVV